jgi:hypothetical protein
VQHITSDENLPDQPAKTMVCGWTVDQAFFWLEAYADQEFL